MAEHILQDLKAFLDTSPTSYHAAMQLEERFLGKDFIPLSEKDKWSLEKGKSYFVRKEGALCAFTLPLKAPLKATILASHTDSPALKLKPSPQIQKENMSLFGVEVYGAPLLSSWLNRDLAIAGKIVMINNEGSLEEKTIFLDDAPLIIPQLAIHLDREVNEKGLILNKQEHLSPLFSLNKDLDLEALIRRSYPFKTLLGFDLFLVPLEESRFIGADSEMLASYRIDNLLSAHAAAAALAKAKNEKSQTLQIAFFSDHEEIGSKTKEGAASPFLEEVLKRILPLYSLSEEDFFRLKAESLCVSIDMAHALHPNHTAKHDPQHKPLLGKGIVLKYNADHKYATTALSASKIMLLCKHLAIPYQQFTVKSDIPCGSTIGPVIASTLGIPTVDIGCPQLSMHSIREITACQDYIDMVALLTKALH